MSTTKIVIICLTLLMAIFFLGLSLNLIEKPHQGVTKDSSNEEKKQAGSPGWVKAMNSILAPFATSLTPQELSFHDCSKMKNGLPSASR